MRVAVVSSFRNGYEVALEACYARALERGGAQVHRIPLESLLSSAGGAWGLLTRGARAWLHQSAIREAVLAAEPDVTLLVKAIGILHSTVHAWRAAGAKVVNVFPDNPFEAIGAAGPAMGLLDQLRACNVVFVHDRLALGQLRRQGVRSEYIAFARDPEMHAPHLRGKSVANPPRIAFVGNPDPERIRLLRAVSDLGLGVWGRWSWAKLSPEDPLSHCIRGEEMLASDMVSCLSSALVSINLLRPSQRTGHNMRTFESPACGVCTLSEASNGVLELMEDGVDLATFTSPTDLRAEALALLSDTRRRESIAVAGWTRVRSETYDARARQVLQSVT